MTARRLRAGFLGRIGYADGVRLQELARARLLEAKAGAARAPGVEETLLLLEHPHVFTLGRNARVGDVTASAAWLASHGVEVHETDRGGQVTYHGPGQLVGYPIVDLDPDRRDLRRYVRDLQEVLIATLAELGLDAFGGEETSAIGVWVEGSRGPEKIASIGVHVKRWVTSHGFALNVATDLDLFGGIVACGLPDVTMTSIERALGARGAGETPSLGTLAEIVARHFARVFERRLGPLDEAEARASLRAERPPVVLPAAAGDTSR